MKNTKLFINPDVEKVFNNYPNAIRLKMDELRALILETAEESDEIEELEETLKWGEPSYLTKKGSTIRIDWKPKKPEQYAIYFKCTSKLVPTFKIVFKEKFEFEGNRAIVFSLSKPIPEAELKQCIATGLRYHRLKQLPLLGL